MIKVKRVYDPPTPEDGKRFLVDRLWPRGLKKEQLQLDGWLKDMAPSARSGSGSATIRQSGKNLNGATSRS